MVCYWRDTSAQFRFLFNPLWVAEIKTPEEFNISNSIYLSNKPRPKAIAKAIAFGRGNLTLWSFVTYIEPLWGSSPR
ncbi:hypothetical protein CHT99_02090 [Sphingobacterium cellulitidis]|nr:hypothetical protein CHT99_02090 [Sphingobacterium cellulitidis]